MSPRAFGERRRVERTLSTLRLIGALGVVVHVAWNADALRAADVWAVGMGAAVAFVAAALSLFGAWYVARTPWSLRIVGAVAIAIDAALLSAIVWACLVADSTASLVWAFLLWLPYSAGVRYRAIGASLATCATITLIPFIALAVDRRIDTSFEWKEVALPMLLVAIAGMASELTAMCHRLSIGSARTELLRARDRSSQLQEADDLKNTFLAAVSHELRTPLTSIMGFAMTLLDRQDDLTPEQRDRMLTTLVVEAEHLEDILANLLDLDRLTRGKATLIPIRVDAAVLVTSSIQHVQRRSSREIQLDLEPDVHVVLDAAKVERIVENLVGNAVKYTPKDAEIIVTLTRANRGITIRVDDSGPGIAPELRDTIFEPFRRGTDVGVPGTGIGLSLVDRFSRMHGGRAWVEARPGGGSRFQVHLPSIDTYGANDGADRTAHGHGALGADARVIEFRAARS